jgi:hypothetical protein
LFLVVAIENSGAGLGIARRALVPPDLPSGITGDGTKTAIQRQDGVAGSARFDEKAGAIVYEWTSSPGHRREFSDELATRSTVVVSAKVLTSPNTGLNATYSYDYVVECLAGSPQPMKSFGIQTTEKAEALETPRDWRFRHLFKGSMKFGGLEAWYWLEFGLRPPDSRAGIDPGTWGRFRLSSSSPPGVTRCFAEGSVPERAWPEEPPDGIAEIQWQVNATNYLSGWTIGPRPAPRSVGEYLDRVAEVVERGSTEGWLQAEVRPRMESLIWSSRERLKEAGADAASLVIEELQRLTRGWVAEGKASSEVVAVVECRPALPK